jgi:hypothetical protein
VVTVLTHALPRTCSLTMAPVALRRSSSSSSVEELPAAVALSPAGKAAAPAACPPASAQARLPGTGNVAMSAPLLWSAELRSPAVAAPASASVLVQDLACLSLSVDDGSMVTAAEVHRELLAANGSTLLLLDLRSFMQFNQAHVKDAINVSVPLTLLRRSNFSLSLIEQGICRPAERARWRARASADVVLYDQTLASTQQNVTLVKLFHALRAENVVQRVRWLADGFSILQTAHPDVCRVCCPIASRFMHKMEATSTSYVLGGGPLTANSQAACGPDAPVQILQDLFLGGEKVASDLALLQAHGIGYVVNAAVECENSFPADLVYLHLNMSDTPAQGNLRDLFETAFTFIGACSAPCRTVLLRRRRSSGSDPAGGSWAMGRQGAERQPSRAGALPRGAVAVGHDCVGVPDAHAGVAPAARVRLRTAAALGYLAQPGLHGLFDPVRRAAATAAHGRSAALDQPRAAPDCEQRAPNVPELCGRFACVSHGPSRGREGVGASGPPS